MLKIGILGSGFIADFHMQAYKQLCDVRVVSVASRTRAESFARSWGISSWFGGDEFMDELCRDRELDAVDICLPNFLHADAVRACADNHKNVILEKPLGRNAREAKEIVDAATRGGVLHGYAENQVYLPQIRRADQTIREGALGRVFHVRAREAHFGPHSEWFWKKELSGGGALLDMGCHSLEVTRKLVSSEPREAFGAGSTQLHRDKTDAEDGSVSLIKYSGGEIGQAENSWSARGGLDLRFEIFGSEGALFLDVTRETGLKLFTVADESKVGYVVEKSEAAKGWLYPIWREALLYGYVDELKDFTDSFAKGELPSENFNDGLVVNQMLDACYRSFSSGRWETIER